MKSAKAYLSLLGALVGWTAVIGQYVLMINNSPQSFFETTIRFFSFFTILTNTFVAVFFTSQLLPKSNSLNSFFSGVEVHTAITMYIAVVGLVYQFVLRQIWEPEGFQMIVDELLHSFQPAFFIFYWVLYAQKSSLRLRQIPKWLIYPLIYLAYILIRGHFSQFYPYPFVDVTGLGYPKVFFNSLVLLCFFLLLSALFIVLSKWITYARNESKVD